LYFVGSGFPKAFFSPSSVVPFVDATAGTGAVFLGGATAVPLAPFPTGGFSEELGGGISN